MLTQEQLINNALTGQGQVLVDPETVMLDRQKIQDDIFLPVLGEYQRIRPQLKRDAVDVGMDGYSIPSAGSKLIKIQRRSLTVTARGAGYFFMDVPATETNYLPDGKSVVAVPGAYQAEYTVAFTLTDIVDQFVLITPAATEVLVEKKLMGVPRNNTVVLTRGGVSITDSAGKFTGSWLTGSDSGFDDKGNLTLSLVAGSMDPILVAFRLKYLAVKELSFVDEPFMKLWGARFLKAYASTKSNIKVDGSPMSVDNEMLLTTVSQLEQTWEEYKKVHSKWWVF